MKLGIGKRYKLRNGSEMGVIQKMFGKNDEFICSVNRTLERYNRDGTYIGAGKLHPMDVVAQI